MLPNMPLRPSSFDLMQYARPVTLREGLLHEGLNWPSLVSLKQKVDHALQSVTG